MAASDRVRLDASERWGLGDFGWLILATLVCGIAAVVVTESLGLSEDSSATDAFFAVGLLVPLTFVPMVVARTKGSGWRSAYAFEVSRRSLAVGAAAGVVATAVMALALAVVERFQEQAATASAAEDLAAASGLGFVVLLLIAAAWAPFAEEMAFRGLLWSAAAKRGWSPWIATVVSALPFAVIHLEPSRFAPLVLSAVILGTARQYGGLASAVVAHLIINGVAATATLIPQT